MSPTVEAMFPLFLPTCHPGTFLLGPFGGRSIQVPPVLTSTSSASPHVRVDPSGVWDFETLGVWDVVSWVS
jgi:hypothetical protein